MSELDAIVSEMTEEKTVELPSVPQTVPSIVEAEPEEEETESRPREAIAS